MEELSKQLALHSSIWGLAVLLCGVFILVVILLVIFVARSPQALRWLIPLAVIPVAMGAVGTFIMLQETASAVVQLHQAGESSQENLNQLAEIGQTAAKTSAYLGSALSGLLALIGGVALFTQRLRNPRVDE